MLLCSFAAAAAFSASSAARSLDSNHKMTTTGAVTPLRLCDLLLSPPELLIVTDEAESSRSSSSYSSLPLGSCFKVPFSHVRRRPPLLTSLLFLLDYGYS